MAAMNKQQQQQLLLSLVTFTTLLSGLSFADQSHQQQRGSWQYGQCQLDRINALEPSYQIQSEGGVSEFWDHNSQDLQCAGAAIHRHRLQPRAMMLPAYHNAPVLAYIHQGRGIFGLLISGCPETFESSEQSQQQQQQYGGSEEEQQRGRRFRDRHQKIGHIRRGDIVAIPAGSAFWSYNTGDEELVVVVFSHTANFANQLDTNPRTFFLAGNPQSSQQQQQQGQQGQQQHEMGNVFRGIDIQILQEAFGIDEETARKLQGHDDQRGHLVIIEKGLQVITPPLREEQEYEQRRREDKTTKNGLEETICTAKLRENIDSPSKADVYNPRAGRFTTVNSFTLPILDFLQLSAAKGVLYRNGMISPHWCVNSHSIVFGTRGEARIQIVDHNGRAVFDGRVLQGQVVVVPQNYAVVKQASEQGFEWVEFNTNGNAMINTLSGRTSALRGLPNDVVANMYQISREQAEDIKYSRQETLLFSSGAAKSSSYERGGAVASA